MCQKSLKARLYHCSDFRFGYLLQPEVVCVFCVHLFFLSQNIQCLRGGSVFSTIRQLLVCVKQSCWVTSSKQTKTSEEGTNITKTCTWLVWHFSVGGGLTSCKPLMVGHC